MTRIAAVPLVILLVSGEVSAAGARPSEDVTVFVQVAGCPGIEAFDAERSLGRAAREARQAALQARARINARVDAVVGGLHVVGRTYNLVPGVQVQTDRATMARLAKRPGVVSVHEVEAPPPPSNADEVQWTKVLNARQPSLGRHGDDMRIAILDTGFDHTHAHFDGPGTKEAYAAIDKTKGDPSFPTKKVVGGYDFVGDVPEKTQPDPNPISCDDQGDDPTGTTLTGHMSRGSPPVSASTRTAPPSRATTRCSQLNSSPR
jgi:hypothetical protein